MATDRLEIDDQPPAEKPLSADWTRETYQRKSAYSAADVAAWDALVRQRREKYQPACRIDGAGATVLLRKVDVETYRGPAGNVLAGWIAKPDGRRRLAYILGDCDDETIVAEVLRDAVLASFDDLAVLAVYWYTDDALGKTGDGRIFGQLPKLIDAQLEGRKLQIEFRGDNANAVWEVSRT